MNEYLPYLTALCRWSATTAGIHQWPPHHQIPQMNPLQLSQVHDVQRGIKSSILCTRRKPLGCSQWKLSSGSMLWLRLLLWRLISCSFGRWDSMVQWGMGLQLTSFMSRPIELSSQHSSPLPWTISQSRQPQYLANTCSRQQRCYARDGRKVWLGFVECEGGFPCTYLATACTGTEWG